MSSTTEISWRYALLLLLVLLLCSHAPYSLGSGLDPATHQAAPPAQDEWRGREETLAGLNVYVTGSPSASAAVIMISDVFGYKTPLFRKLADKVASSGYYVVAPDYFKGDPYIASPGSDPFADILEWIARHPPAAEVETTKKLVEALEAELGIKSVGLAGFCWGGKVVVLVGKQKGVVKAIVQLHPGMTAASDYEEVQVPISILAAPSDGIQEFKGLLHKRRKEVKIYVKIFTQVVHGWTIRYDETNKKEVKKANRAHRLMLKWFHEFL